jgi:hypothetical protein
MDAGIARDALGNPRALVRATVNQPMQGSTTITRDHDRHPPDEGGEVIIGGGGLTFEAKKNPSALENPRHFQIKNSRFVKYGTVNAKDAFIGAVINQIGKVQR